jgi:DNA-binding CsgD family transcriptional regulator
MYKSERYPVTPSRAMSNHDIANVLVARPLTPREREVWALIVAGKSRKETAHQIGIAHSTVRVLYARAVKKLAAPS